MSKIHWHVAFGLDGYGPDGSNGCDTATDLPGTADLIADELRRAAQSESDAATAAAESGDYRDAWDTRERADSLATTANNFDNSRANAPLYAGRPDLWAETIERMIGETFPLRVSHNGSLHVWPCTESACEHLSELLDA